MDLFGFKRRRTAKEAKARQRARAMENAIRLANEQPPAPPASTRRRYPERYAADDGLTGGRTFPPSMAVDNNYASWAQPDTGSTHSHGSHGHSSLGEAGSGLGFGGHDSGSSSSHDTSGGYTGD
jgi:hypothetical protein